LDDILGSGTSRDNLSFGFEWLGSLGGESSNTDIDECEDWKANISVNCDRFFKVDGNNLSFEEWAENPKLYRSVALTDT